MEEEKKVSEETKASIPNVNPYSKIREEDDAETEAFAKGELAKFQREQKEKEATAATEQNDTDAAEETAEKSEVKATPIAERPAKAEDRVFKKRYDDLKKHYDSTINKHKDEVTSLRSQLESSTKEFVPLKSKSEYARLIFHPTVKSGNGSPICVLSESFTIPSLFISTNLISPGTAPF